MLASPGWAERFARLPAAAPYWCEVVAPKGNGQKSAQIGRLLGSLLGEERDALDLASELAERYEEIELLYTISEVLGRTIRLDEAARRIAEEVSRVVGARRASILVFDDREHVLRPVAGFGIDVTNFAPIPVDDPLSVAAQVFREHRMIAFDPTSTSGIHTSGEHRPYKGSAFLSVPIMYPVPDAPPRPVGVINLTDRFGTDAFRDAEVRLVSAIANQIGAAIENARLVDRDLAQQRLRHELALAHDLQLKLLTPPTLSGTGVDIAARCVPAESVGGDFYHVLRLSNHRLGVMLGDVSSHGFGAALMMAVILSAAGIHAQDSAAPDETLRRLLDSVAGDLAKTEMYLTLFYGVVEPDEGRLRYANAGHPHAFRVTPDGTSHRLGATTPPLGLGLRSAIVAAETPWNPGEDMLLLFSDGVAEAPNAVGDRFGEARVLALAGQLHAASADMIADEVFAALQEFGALDADDRTVLVLKG